jgi:hypothetical protein
MQEKVHFFLFLASITYPWGAGNHVKGLPHTTRGYIEEKQSTESPDLISFAKIVQILKNTASTNSYLPSYKVNN